MFLLRRPPKNFEALVEGHFRDRARSILSACKVYLNGRAKIGFYRSESESESACLVVSENFKKGMKALYPELWRQFSLTGADLGNYVEPEEVKVKEVKKTASEEKGKGKGKKKSGGALWKLLKVLGLKKMAS